MFETTPVIPAATDVQFVPGRAAPAITSGIVEVAGQPHMRDAKGRLVPIELVKPADKLEDEMVRKVMAFAQDLAAQISRFKEHTFADLNGFQKLLEQDYGARAGGEKGNVTFQTVDGLMQVKVQIADLIELGPQLQQAKALIDECLVEWGSDSRPEIRAVITGAFAVEKEGQINKANLFLLLKLDIVEERWTNAMKAIRDAIRVTGTKEYVRFYQRKRPQDRFEAIPINIADA
ncbi:DUF3164 family protein [Bosea sp. MMO-172]|uniref:DUF3164 family protein n=1 Tax=Bosea sp. MMO-172 TaxID=3127885 RepID=UPI003018F06D